MGNKMNLNLLIKIKEKKGQQQMFWIIMAAVIAIVATVFMILWFRSSGGAAFESVGSTIDKFGDCDNDDIANYFDKCPCDAGIAEFDGCNTKQTKKNECSPEKLKLCAENKKS